MSTITVETYARIGLVAGSAATIIPAWLEGTSLLAALAIGPIIGLVTGAVYGMLRLRFAR
jgi:hypothetical protein